MQSIDLDAPIPAVWCANAEVIYDEPDGWGRPDVAALCDAATRYCRLSFCPHSRIFVWEESDAKRWLLRESETGAAAPTSLGLMISLEASLQNDQTTWVPAAPEGTGNARNPRDGRVPAALCFWLARFCRSAGYRNVRLRLHFDRLDETVPSPAVKDFLGTVCESVEARARDTIGGDRGSPMVKAARTARENEF